MELNSKKINQKLIKYCKITIRTQKGIATMWGKNFRMTGETFVFTRCRTDGDEWMGNGSRLKIVSGKGDDLVSIKEAAINNTYGTLEIVRI